ncbi:MAG: alpha/beta hydrolase [Chloroflexi bacterium]|nr:MAG: alpha/beta hydrolase [Chloroflexota bacterium]
MRSVVSKDGTRIAFDQSGQGPALILVSGASATRKDEASAAAALAPYFTVFAYDRRARGDSGDTPPYAVEREVEDIGALVDEAGGSAFVFGHSSGAVLALETARLLPGRITRLAVYEPPFIIDNSRPPAPADFVSHLNELVSSGRRGEAVEVFMKVAGLPAEMIAQMRQSPTWPRMEADAQSFVYDATIVADTERGDPSALKKWESTTVPTLVMDGTVFLGHPEPHEFMRHGADELARVLPNSRRLTLEGQDHGPADDVLVPALREFYLG